MLLASLALVCCLAPATVAAQQKEVFDQVPCGTSSVSLSEACAAKKSGDTLTGPNGTLSKATRLIAYIAGIGAMIVMVVGGLMYILSSGDAQKISAAKNTVLYALIGLVIVVAAQGIIIFVLNRL